MQKLPAAGTQPTAMLNCSEASHARRLLHKMDVSTHSAVNRTRHRSTYEGCLLFRDCSCDDFKATPKIQKYNINKSSTTFIPSRIKNPAIPICKQTEFIVVTTFWHQLSRILVTRQVINGFRSRWIDLLDIRQAELQLVITQSYCNYNTSQLQTMITLSR
jgi:hypothetical protein